MVITITIITIITIIIINIIITPTITIIITTLTKLMKQMEAKCRETVATREAVEEKGGKVPPEDDDGHYH